MDRRKLIVIASLTCALILILITLGAIHLFKQKCALISATPEILALDGRHRLAGKKPFRSTDKTLLIKISAHLDYQPQAAYSRQDWQPISQAPTGGIGQYQGVAQVQPIQPPQQAPLLPQVSIANASIAPTAATVEPAVETNIAPSNQNEKRFMPLKLIRVVGKDSNDRYMLDFDCCKMFIKFSYIPLQEKIIVNSMRLELDTPNWNETSCELRPKKEQTSTSIFGAGTNAGLAHYQCDDPESLLFSCWHRTEHSLNQKYSEYQIADLQIHSIEFQTSNTTKVPMSEVFRSSYMTDCH